MDKPQPSFASALCLFLCGISINIQYKLTLVASQDILAGTALPTCVVLLALVAPDLLVRLVTPWTVRRLPILVSVGCGMFAAILAVIALVLGTSVYIRIAAVAVIGAVASWNLVWCMAIVAAFHHYDQLISAYSYGKSAAAVGGIILYIGLTSWLCVSPQIVIGASVTFSILTGVVYVCLDSTWINHETVGIPGIDTGRIKYHKVPTTDQDVQPAETVQESLLEVRVTWTILTSETFTSMAYMFCNGTATALSQFAILTTLAFPAPTPRDAFLYYMLAFNTARCISSYEFVIVSHLCPKILRYVKVDHVWVIAVLDVSFAAMFLFASWFRFLPNLASVIALVFIHGLVNGSLSLHTVSDVTNKFEHLTDCDYALRMCQMGYHTGLITAGIAGSFLEKLLYQNCVIDRHLGEFCLTRFSSVKGWSKNLHCAAT